jgi:exoribonuclease-2
MRHPLTQQKSSLASIAAWAMFSRGLAPEFAPEALHQLASLKEPASEPGDSSIRDLRSLLWCSLDNDDSRDLDQLTVCEPLPEGGMRILVAVADVDALVKKGSPVDLHARQNTTSVYTSARIFPMLPEKLCTDLTSLNPGEDRLAIVSDMVFAQDGTLSQQTLYRARVHNHAQLAYDAVSDWIDGKGDLPAPGRRVPGMDVQLRLQDAHAQKLRVLRFADGALDFQTFQPRASFEGETITGLLEQPHNRGRQLIEEFMIAANGCMARFLGAHGGASLRRVVRSPERWARIVDVAREHGATLPSQPDGKALSVFLAEQRRLDPLRFPDLSLVIVKLMGRGEYVVERPGGTPIGHFGLAVRQYTHSTAPNRRYPDLITQRMLKAALAGGKSPYSATELDDLAVHCTAQEDAAQKVERQMRKSEAALLLHSRIGQRFNGIVTGSGDSGVWVRIFEPPVEGRIKGEMPELGIGQRVRVRLVSTSVERGFIDFVMAREPG